MKYKWKKKQFKENSKGKPLAYTLDLSDFEDKENAPLVEEGIPLEIDCEKKIADPQEDLPESEERMSADDFDNIIKEEEEKLEELSNDELESMIDSIITNGKDSSEEKSLEERKEEARIKKVTSWDLPLDYQNSYSDNEVLADNAQDGLILSVENLGRVDIEYIASVTGLDPIKVLISLRDDGAIYQNPRTWGENILQGWELKDDYLSGNLLSKLKIATKANEKYLGHFERNIELLKKHLPKATLFDDIYFSIGSPWIPASIYNEFLSHLLSLNYKLPDGVAYDTALNKWVVRYNSLSRYDTKKMKAVEIFERTLNNRPIKVFDIIERNGRKFRILDGDATIAAQAVQKSLILLFRSWIKDSPSRMKKLEDIYFEKFGTVTARHYSGKFLKLPGLNPQIQLYEHQKNAVLRIMLSRNTLLAHAVGTGKTYVMICAGMEMRRIGISKRNMYVVPNAVLKQWEESFREAYPDKSVFVMDRHNMDPAHREESLRIAKEGDFDAYLISYTAFESIPVGKRRVRAELMDKLSGLPKSAEYDWLRRDIQKKIAEVDKEIANEPSGVKFEQLKINTLFVDEAHNFKNITVETNSMTLGISKAVSKRADEMHLKIRVLRRSKEGRSVVFATGTPITNSITEVFAMQMMLQPKELKLLNLDTFDKWALTFGEKTQAFEMDVDACNYRIAERFNRFHNIPELSNIFAGVADFHLEEMDSILYPSVVDKHTIIVPRSASQSAYIRSLADRADKIRNGVKEDEKDNLLKITVDGRKAALDIRLADPKSPGDTNNKIKACASEVARIYVQTEQITQLVFCDISTPSKKFNAYDELKKELIALGVKESEIAFVHEFKSDSARLKMFEKVNNGELRVLIGSTATLGTGVNVQRKLFAVHHLDVPWRPSDMVQREGRMVRQGNLNDYVEIYRYVTDGSFDAYSWQLLESKQRFICQILAGNCDRRDGEDIDSVVLDYAEIKALAIGDPRIKERVETSNELERLKMLKSVRSERKEFLGDKLKSLPRDIETTKSRLEAYRKDFRRAQKFNDEHINRKELGSRLIDFACDLNNKYNGQVVESYKGFDIKIPSVVIAGEPVIYVCGAYEKRISVTNSDGTRSAIGLMARIDNYINGLSETIISTTKQLKEYERQLNEYQKEYDDNDDLDDRILDLTNKLNYIDIQLGVIKDE